MLLNKLFRNFNSKIVGKLSPQILSANRTKFYFSSSTTTQEPQFIKITSQKTQGVSLIQLSRPKALNALCDQLMYQLSDALKAVDNDPTTGCAVITGSKKAFAAGADIKQMQPHNFSSAFYNKNLLAHWDSVSKTRKPIIAAVDGYALGGGCQLAMMCDIIYASKTAKFGQPQITLGTIPGCGGTQRLIRAIGKSRAMQLILTGEFMDAEEAHNRGLVSKLFQSEKLVTQALSTAKKIAGNSKLTTILAKEAVLQSMEMGLSAGVNLERRLFHASFSTSDQDEGMKAFSEKRKPSFKDQ